MRFSMNASPNVPAQSLLYLTAALSLVAALIHIWVMQDHFEEWWGYGAFFLVMAVGQAAYGLVLLNWPRRGLILVGMVSVLVIMILYTINHTTGVPYFGPHAGEPEQFTILGLVSKAIEMGIALALWGLSQAQFAARSSSPVLQHQTSGISG